MLGRRPRIALPIVLQAVLIGSLVGKLVVCREQGEMTCGDAIRNGTPALAVSLCSREYASARDPEVGMLLADHLYRTDNRVAARAQAEELVSVPEVQANALQLIGRLHLDEGAYPEALAALDRSLVAHARDGDRPGAARDLYEIGYIQLQLDDHGKALDALERCIELARTVDEVQLGYCQLIRARVLVAAGRARDANSALREARARLLGARARADVLFEMANLRQELAVRDGGGEPAVLDYQTAGLLASMHGGTELALAVHLNLAFTLAELGRTDEAASYLASARLYDRNDEKASQRAQLAARIAYRRGQLEEAWAQNAVLYPTIKGSDEKIDVCVMQARIGIARGDLAAAAVWAKRGADIAEALRREQIVELRAWELDRRRLPAELLFSIHAWMGHPTEAVLALDLWHGRTLVDRLGSGPWVLGSMASGAGQVADAESWTSSAAASQLAAPVAREDVLATLQQIDLLALVVADGWVWRVSSRAGDIQLSAVGTARGLEPALLEIRSAPTSTLLADWLGRQLVGDALGRTTSEPLHVLLDPSLTSLPIAALRIAGQPLVARRPVVRTLRLPRVVCVPPARAEGVAVIADSLGDLAAARREALAIGEMFGPGTKVSVGEAATRRALLASAGSRILHLAVHGRVDAADGVGSIVLADRSVTALEIAAGAVRPPVVMLAACSSAEANDPERATALATGFLMAGSQQVVATLQNVYDKPAGKLVARFYAQGGGQDPVRALASAQAWAATDDPTANDWAYFAVFGSPTCTSP